MRKDYIDGLNKEYNKDKVSYWYKILGSELFFFLLEKHISFEDYLKDKNVVDTENICIEQKKFICISNTKDMLNNSTDVYFRAFYNRFLNHGIKELQEKNKENEQFFSKDIYYDFTGQLLNQLQKMCIRTLIVKLQEYDKMGMLKVSDKKEKYEVFCNNIINQDFFIKEMCLQFPVLFLCIDRKIAEFVDFYADIIEFFKQDQLSIQENLLNSKKNDKIIGLLGDFSDLHNNGRQVLKVVLESGEEIFFKPHSMYNELIFNELQQWIGEKTGIDYYSYPILTYSNHSWCACVAYKTCDTIQQLKKYYTRLGQQLFLAYLLGTKDLHCENIIASGEYPVLIDLETLVNIQFNHSRVTANEEVYFQLSQSVLYTGLLPFYSWNQEGKGIDNSSIGGGGGQIYPFKIPYIAHPGTSDMRVEYKYPTTKKCENLATVKGKYYDSSFFKDELIHGFMMAYKISMFQKEKLMKWLKFKLCKVESRFLLADTQRYDMLITSSYHPSLLKDEIERVLYLYTIKKKRTKKENIIIESEVDSMISGDIPYFYYKLNEKALYTPKGLIIENYFYKEPIYIVKEKVLELSYQDLKRQVEFIDTALKLVVSRDKESCINRTYKVNYDVIPYLSTDEETVNLQKNVIYFEKKIWEHAVWNSAKTEVNWFVLQLRNHDKMVWDFHPMNMYLYNGLSGMLIILDKIKDINKNIQSNNIYETLKQMMFRYTDDLIRADRNLSSLKIGAYDGESSIIYTYLYLYKRNGEAKFLQYAQKHVKLVEKLIDKDTSYDIMYGNAGAAQVLTLLYKTTHNVKYLYLAEKAVKVLVRSANRVNNGLGWVIDNNFSPMMGVAHGNSGILIPLASLWNITKKDKYKQLIKQILNYENFLYEKIHNTWIDSWINAQEQSSDNLCCVGWCHGVSGILLSRIYCYDNVHDEKIKKVLEVDIQRAYKTLKTYWRRDSWSLCHGCCGNLWIMEYVEKKLNKEKTFNTDFNMELLPQETINPGLFDGYGGILFYLTAKLDCNLHPYILNLVL